MNEEIGKDIADGMKKFDDAREKIKKEVDQGENGDRIHGLEVYVDCIGVTDYGKLK